MFNAVKSGMLYIVGVFVAIATGLWDWVLDLIQSWVADFLESIFFVDDLAIPTELQAPLEMLAWWLPLQTLVTVLGACVAFEAVLIVYRLGRGFLKYTPVA
jgi:hypothetical protein